MNFLVNFWKRFSDLLKNRGIKKEFSKYNYEISKDGEIVLMRINLDKFLRIDVIENEIRLLLKLGIIIEGDKIDEVGNQYDDYVIAIMSLFPSNQKLLYFYLL